MKILTSKKIVLRPLGRIGVARTTLRGVPPLHAGLCDACRHQKLIGNTRGSTFSMCERSKTDDRFPKYPRLPVGECPGFERREAAPPATPSRPG